MTARSDGMAAFNVSGAPEIEVAVGPAVVGLGFNVDAAISMKRALDALLSTGGPPSILFYESNGLVAGPPLHLSLRVSAAEERYREENHGHATIPIPAVHGALVFRDGTDLIAVRQIVIDDDSAADLVKHLKALMSSVAELEFEVDVEPLRRVIVLLTLGRDESLLASLRDLGSELKLEVRTADLLEYFA